jgi:hypothetical protein
VPSDPKGHRRPADVIGNAVDVAKIPTGELGSPAADDAKTRPRRPWG